MKVMLCVALPFEDARVSVLSGEYVIQPKLDGVRAYIEKGCLFDRRGNDITQRFPEFIGLKQMRGDILDGEIIARSGKFEDISGRVHMADKFLIEMSAKCHPAQFVVFDVVNSDVFIERRKLLESMKFPVWMRLISQADGTVENLDAMWKRVVEKGEEGIVLKVKSSFYVEKRSTNWLKIKAWKEEVVEFSDYEPHPKGVTLQTHDGRRVVVNGGMAEEVRERYKKDGRVTAEIQYLPQDSGEWRFPSFRRLL